MRHLTKKQRVFIEEYKKDNNGTNAVIKADYNVKDRLSASVIASQNLKKPLIKAEIDNSLLELNITPSLVLTRVKQLLLSGENETAVLQSAKYLLELLGYSPEESEKESSKIIVNIKGSVIPLNLINKAEENRT